MHTCKTCNYETDNRTNYAKHLKSKRHLDQRKIEELSNKKIEKELEEENDGFYWLDKKLIEELQKHYAESSVRKFDQVLKSIHSRYLNIKEWTRTGYKTNLKKLIDELISSDSLSTATKRGYYHHLLTILKIVDNNHNQLNRLTNLFEESRDIVMVQAIKKKSENPESEKKKETEKTYNKLDVVIQTLKDDFERFNNYKTAIRLRTISLYYYLPAVRPSDFLKCQFSENKDNFYLDIDEKIIHLGKGKSSYGGDKREWKIPEELIKIINETSSQLGNEWLLPQKNIRQRLRATNEIFDEVFGGSLNAREMRQLYETKLKNDLKNNVITEEQYLEHERFLNHTALTSMTHYDKYDKPKQESIIQQLIPKTTPTEPSEQEPIKKEPIKQEPTIKQNDYSAEEVEDLIDYVDVLEKENNDLKEEIKKLKKFILDKYINSESIDIDFY